MALSKKPVTGMNATTFRFPVYRPCYGPMPVLTPAHGSTDGAGCLAALGTGVWRFGCFRAAGPSILQWGAGPPESSGHLNENPW